MTITIQQARAQLAAALEFHEEEVDLCIRRSKEFGLLPLGRGGRGADASPPLEAEHITFLIFQLMAPAWPKRSPLCAIELAFTEPVDGAFGHRPSGVSEDHPLRVDRMPAPPPDIGSKNRGKPLMQRSCAWRTVHSRIQGMRKGELPRLHCVEFGYFSAEEPFVNLTAEFDGPDLNNMIVWHARTGQDRAAFQEVMKRRRLSGSVGYEAFAKVAAFLGSEFDLDAAPSPAAIALYRRMGEIAEERGFLEGTGESRARRRETSALVAAHDATRAYFAE
jgi:hypothetical protein